ncbi:MAG: DMT family transporter [Myxococcales bacterium]|nr:DMT family transporter [Myxococcales bacterium]
MRASGRGSTWVRLAPAVFVLLWSTGYVGARFGLPFAEPLTLTALRFAIVVLLLVVLVLVTRRSISRDPWMWGHWIVTGILIHTCFIGGIFFAIDRGVGIGVAALVAGVQPLLTAAAGSVLLGESLGTRQWTGFLMGFAGLSLVVAKGLTDGALPLAGLIGCFIGLLGITFGTLYQKRYVVGTDLLAGSSVQFAAAVVPCAIGSFLFESQVIEWNLTVVLVLAWLCVVMSIGAISILLFLIREGAASRVSSLFYLVPLVTAVQGVVLFDESLSWVQWAGVAVTAVGVAMINIAPKTASVSAVQSSR